MRGDGGEVSDGSDLLREVHGVYIEVVDAADLDGAREAAGVSAVF